MDRKETGRIFYRDGYRLASQFLEGGVNESKLRQAIRSLYGSVDGLLEAFVRRSAREGKPATCKKGCAWCCHQAVFGVTHELLYIHDHLLENFGEKRRRGFLEKAKNKSTQTLHHSLEEQLKLRLSCPFLVEGACAIYPVRPMACRIYLSASLAACIREHNEPANRQFIPELFDFPLHAGRMLNEGFVAYLKQVGMRSEELPLEQGYVSAVESGHTFATWIRGRPCSA
jgi:Fe-S-cluster containining protein